MITDIVKINDSKWNFPLTYLYLFFMSSIKYNPNWIKLIRIPMSVLSIE